MNNKLKNYSLKNKSKINKLIRRTHTPILRAKKTKKCTCKKINNKNKAKAKKIKQI